MARLSLLILKSHRGFSEIEQPLGWKVDIRWTAGTSSPTFASNPTTISQAFLCPTCWPTYRSTPQFIWSGCSPIPSQSTWCSAGYQVARLWRCSSSSDLCKDPSTLWLWWWREYGLLLLSHPFSWINAEVPNPLLGIRHVLQIFVNFLHLLILIRRNFESVDSLKKINLFIQSFFQSFFSLLLS